MTGKIVYTIHKARPQGAEVGDEMRWILIRGGTVDNGSGYTDCLPEADAAIFSSEKEANLFSGYLRALESKAGL